MANEVVINVKANTDKAKTGLESMRSAMKKVGAAATVAGAAIIGIGVASLKSFSSAGDEVHKMSLRTGFGTEALSELRLAAELSGTSLGALETGVRRMQMSIVDAGRGVKLSVDAFDALGMTVDSIKNLSPEEQFDKMTVALAGIDDVALRTKTAMDLFGRAGTQLLPMLAGGEEGLEAMKQQAHDLGLVFDEEAAAKAARLNDAMTTMKASMTGVMMMIAEQLAPTVSMLAEKIGIAVSKISAWADENPKLAKMIVLITGAIGAFLMVLGPILLTLAAVSSILPILGVGFAILTGPIGLIVLAITAMGIAWSKNMFGIKDITASVVNSVIGMINVLIRALNSIQIPSWVPGIGGKGIDIPEIGFSMGGSSDSSSPVADAGHPSGSTFRVDNFGNATSEFLGNEIDRESAVSSG